MKKLIFLLCLFLIGNVAAQKDGFVMEYKLDGTGIGNTKIDGNMEMIVKPNMQKISGNIVYEEQGNPYPTLDEQELVVDFGTKTRYHQTSESHGWSTSSLDLDYTHLADSSIKKTIKKETGKSTVSIDVSLPESLGGNHNYTIELTWTRPVVPNEVEVFTRIARPSAADLFSLFIDNEKIVEQIGKLLEDARYDIPDSFIFTMEQGGKIQQTVKGVLRSKIILVPSDKWFSVK